MVVVWACHATSYSAPVVLRDTVFVAFFVDAARGFGAAPRRDDFPRTVFVSRERTPATAPATTNAW